MIVVVMEPYFGYNKSKCTNLTHRLFIPVRQNFYSGKRNSLSGIGNRYTS